MDRTKGIGGSDAKKIIDGDWQLLWEEKTKRVKPKDLSNILAVQMGILTESFNLEWLQKSLVDTEYNYSIKKNITVEPIEFMMSHLDGFIKEKNMVVEAKHVNAQNNLDDVADYYYPQLQHYMMHTNSNNALLSVFFGNNRHEWTIVSSDKPYQKKLYNLEKKFWNHVITDTMPDNYEQTDLEKNIILDDMKIIDMSDNNHLTSLVNRIKSFQPCLKWTKNATDEIKNYMEDNCRKVILKGATVVRNKKGVKILRIANE